MKKLTALVLALTMALSLAACGGGQSSSGGGDGDFTTDLTAFYNDSVEKASSDHDFPMMMPLDDDMLESIYPGLAAVDRKQTVCNTAAISAVACEISLVEVANAEDVKTVQDIFQARIDAQVAGGAQYPETIDAWKNDSSIVTRGNCVCLFVMPADFGDFASDFNAL